MRCAAYCRVSLEEQATNYSLPSQRRAILDFAQRNGHTIPDDFVFVDDGYSGENLDRPGISRLRELIRSRVIEGVVIYSIDRLSRTVAHQAIVLEECQKAGVAYLFTNMPVEQTPEALLMLHLAGAFAQYERQKIYERTIRGRREKARQGFIVGGRVPYGYRYVGKAQNERGRLEIDEHQAPVVKQIFDWAAEGVTLREITFRLNDAGHRSHRGLPWGRSSVARLVHHRAYVGCTFYNRLKRVEGLNASVNRRDKKTRREQRPESDWIPVPVPAIITEELFERVQIRLNHNREVFAGRPSRFYLLHGLLWCPCGRKFGADPNHGTRYYRCLGRDRLKDNGCRAAVVPAEKIEAAVWDTVTAVFTDPHKLRPILEAHIAEFAVSDTKQKIADLAKQVDRLRAKEFRAAQALIDTELAEHAEMFRFALRDARRHRVALEAQIATNRRDDCAGVLETVDEVCEAIREVIAGLDLAGRREFLARVVERIVYAKQEAVMHCSLPELSQPSERCGNRRQPPPAPASLRSDRGHR